MDETSSSSESFKAASTESHTNNQSNSHTNNSHSHSHSHSHNSSDNHHLTRSTSDDDFKVTNFIHLLFVYLHASYKLIKFIILSEY
jgi:hypothetical protein